MSATVKLPRLSRTRDRFVAVGVMLLVVIAAFAVTAVLGASPGIGTEQRMIDGVPEPGQGVVQLDSTLYLPASTPAPAVLLAHGFGGSKRDLDAQARSLAASGFVVLAYTARGFGSSGGLIHLDAPGFEVADARKMIDYLATRSEVRLDGPGDPRVGVAGSSYGGALALLLGGYDKRVDAVTADITWNDLAHSLVPDSATGTNANGGVFKKLWAGYLFGAGALPGASGGVSTSGPTSACGRFAADLCGAYQLLAQSNAPNPSVLALLAASSPASIVDKISAPTLLTQGEQDSLFGLGEADANARGIAAHGTPVAVRWRAGGHDTGGGTVAAESAAMSWFGDVLHGRSPAADYQVTLRGAGLSAQSGERVSQELRANGGYPRGVPMTNTVSLHGAAQQIQAPAGGTPAAISSLPGLSTVLDLAGTAGGLGALTEIPGQVAAFQSDPLPARVLLAGSSRVTISLTSPTATDATLFVALRDVDPSGASTLPAQLVAPVQLTGLTPGQASTLTLTLPAVVTQIEADHRVRLTVATTDQAYLMPTDPRSYQVALTADPTVQLPTLANTTIRSGPPWIWLIVGAIAAALAVLAGLLLVHRMRPRRFVVAADESGGPADAPVVVTDLVKEYSDGFRAVDGVTFRVERGQIVGLLGPNGAGKTTTLRVIMGLIRPTDGSVSIFGAPVVPGAQVLSRVGSFIEGPGLLPHLSGEQNLRLFWAATGRPAAEAQFDTALEIAGLGSSLGRRVKTYSQGMRQRLAIAQAMLGLPELLVLDEPTNGLDPPQIAEMRLVLRTYAETGRTVVISSHLLTEVEQTCSHVVVMHRGRLVAAGSVTDIAGTGAVTLAVEDPDAARAILVAAGIDATEVRTGRALEDVFLELVGESP